MKFLLYPVLALAAIPLLIIAPPIMAVGWMVDKAVELKQKSRHRA